MALLEDMLKGGGTTGLAVGLGVVVLGPVLFPAVARVARPAAKVAVKTGISVYRQAVAGIGDAAGGLIEEARAELEHERTRLAGGAAELPEEGSHAGRGRGTSKRPA